MHRVITFLLVLAVASMGGFLFWSHQETTRAAAEAEASLVQRTEFQSRRTECIDALSNYLNAESVAELAQFEAAYNAAKETCSPYLEQGEVDELLRKSRFSST